MATAAAADSAAAGEAGLVWRFARRELRSGIAGFAVFLACLALGVAAIAAVGIINAGVLASLERDSGALLGGDLAIESTNFAVPEEELRAVMPARSKRSDIVRTNAMAYGAEGRRVVVAL
jgi:putative ABC transport system permease protein